MRDLLGIPPGEMSIDWNQVIFKGLFIKGIYGREMFEITGPQAGVSFNPSSAPLCLNARNASRRSPAGSRRCTRVVLAFEAQRLVRILQIFLPFT
jgi:hypothetical protein